MPPVVAVDIDEVLACFVKALCEFHNERYATSLEQSDFFSYTFCNVWGGDRDESVEKVQEFLKSPYFKNISLVPGAKEGVKQLQELGFDLVVVTSRQLLIQEATKTWLAKHFPPDTFQQIAFGNHWGLEGRKITKLDLCKELGASILIDDSLDYCSEVAAAGLKALLLDLDGEYGWNKSDDVPLGVTRLTSWKEVVDHLRP